MTYVYNDTITLIRGPSTNDAGTVSELKELQFYQQMNCFFGGLILFKNSQIWQLPHAWWKILYFMGFWHEWGKMAPQRLLKLSKICEKSVVWPRMMRVGRHVEHAKTIRSAPWTFLSNRQEVHYFELNCQDKVIFGDLQASEFN